MGGMGQGLLARTRRSTWRVVAVIVFGAVVSMAIVLVLYSRVDEAGQVREQVDEVRHAARDLRYEVAPFLYGRAVTPDAVQEYRNHRVVLDHRLEVLRSGTSDSAMTPVDAAADAFAWQTSVLMETAKYGRLDYAAELDHTVVADEFDRLDGALRVVSRSADRSAHRSRVEFFVGLVASGLLAGLVSLTVARRHDRSEEGKDALLVSTDALAASEARFRALLLNSTDVIFVLDDTFRVKDVTAAVHAILGYEPEELIGTSIIDLMHPDDLAAMGSSLERKQADDLSSGVACVRCRHRDGTWRDLESAYHDCRDDPNVAGIVVNTRDVTARKHLEVDLRRSQRLESVGQLAAGIAHEINTPIQFVGDNVQFLTSAFLDIQRLLDGHVAIVDKVRAGTIEPGDIEALDLLGSEVDSQFLFDEIPSAVAQSSEGIEQVARIVRAMKTFGHPNGEAMAPANINEALRSTLVVARSEYKYVAAVQTHLDELPLVTCHIGELNQVFLNLLVNAAHAVADAKDHDGRKGSIVVATSVQGDRAIIAFADNGCGMSTETKDRIFEPFFTTKEVGRGTGQGLALAYSTIVDRHQGTITVDSTVGEGTVFRIALPLRSVAEVVAPAPSSLTEVLA